MKAKTKKAKPVGLAFKDYLMKLLLNLIVRIPITEWRYRLVSMWMSYEIKRLSGKSLSVSINQKNETK